jgi:tetratricopeptide (TPR) repeat protein
MERDAIKEALDAAQRLLFERNYPEACRLMRDAFDTARAEGRSEDAAALSGILATYLSLAGDEAAAHEAYTQAEELQPDNPHHSLATAKHLFLQLGEKVKAREKIDQLLAREHDPLFVYKARIIMGRFALAEKATERAAVHLKEAHDIASSADLLPIWWDTYLAKKLLDKAHEAHAYFDDLLTRARAAGDERVVNEIEELFGTAT